MGRVTTNNTQIAYAPEDPNNVGELPTNPVWTLLEPNDITDFSAELTTTPRNPISPTRQRRKGAVTDLDATAGFEHDTTYGLLEEFIPAFCFANRTNDDLNVRQAPVLATGFTVSGYPEDTRTEENSLYVADGYANPANNGLFRATDDATATLIEATGQNLEAENSPPSGARIRFAGKRIPTAQSTSILPVANAQGNFTDGVVTLTTTSQGPNWAMAGLVNGQTIVIARPGDEGERNHIIGRVRETTATSIRLDKATQTGSVPTTSDIDVLYGGFVRNVAVSDQANYLERSYTVEATWDNLENDADGNPTGNDMYQYLLGGYCNSIALNLAGQSLATATIGFIGTDMPSPVASADRKTGASGAYPTPRTDALNTTADIARLRILRSNTDTVGLTTFFDSATLTLNNNVSPEKVLGRLDAPFINFGNFEVDLESDVIFTNAGVIEAVRNNETV